MRKITSLLLVVVMCISLCGCQKATEENNNKLNIVTTMFPYYDITRAVIGDVEGIGLEMAVAPGQDSHSFEPTPAEIIKMEEADLFIYNGGEIETWVDTVLESFEGSDQVQVEMMETAEDIILMCAEEHSYAENSHFKHSHEGHNHEHNEVDPHIWTSPVNAIIITQTICKTLSQLMPEAAEEFKKNANNYVAELKGIDTEFRYIVDSAEHKKLVFADQFPLVYFTEEYGLECHAAFPGCGHDMEPSVKDVCELIDIIKEDNIQAVFHLELSSEKVADAICEDTGAVKLQFNSCHNVSQKQFDDGVTYVDLMWENVESLKQAVE